MSDSQRPPVPLAPAGGTFDFKTGPAFASAYLDTYYRDITADEEAVSRFLVHELARRPPIGCFIELGCGPTIHHVLPFVPYVREVHMADYLDENLDHVRLWVAASPRAHDWSRHTSMTLRHEGRDDSRPAVLERERQARAKITAVVSCDLKSETPSERRGRYDAVGCFYCTEEIGIELDAWRQVLGHAAAYLRPGGTLYMASLAGMSHYTVRDASGAEFAYPCANLHQADVAAALADLGFPAHATTLETAEIEHPDCGVTAALVVAAVKGRA